MKIAVFGRHVAKRQSVVVRPVAFVLGFALALTTVFTGVAPSGSASVIGNSTISLVATPTSSTFGQSVSLAATVRPVPPAAGTPTGMVTFKVDGVQVTSSPLSGGVATTSTTSLAGGAHTITAVYPGDASFNGSSKSINYTVGCGTTITGSHGQIVAASGSTTCLSGATISGAIILPSGAAIDIENSTISGSFSASSAPGAIRICGSTFGGSMTIINAQALVTVGDPAEGCASNTITGTLLLQNNTNGVRAIGNKVGSLVNTGNSGPGPYPGIPTLITSHAPPIASNDNYLVLENQTLTVSAPGVLGNDSAPSGGTLTAALVAAPVHGTVTLNSDGSFTYVPAAGFFGTDSFTYQNSDGIALSNVGTVTISVHAPPIAVNDSYTLVQGTTLTVAAPGVLGNDSAPSGGALAAAVVNNPTNGTLTLNANGSFTYTPTPSFHGTDSFTYQDSDGITTSNVATVTLTVNTPPSVIVTKSEPSPGAGVTVTAGQSAPISYQFSVANSGQTPSGAFTLTDPVPAGATVVSASATCPSGLTSSSTPSCAITTGSSITWTFSSIPALTTYSGFGFQVSVNSADSNGSTVANAASFTNVNTPTCTTTTCTTNTVSNPVITPTAVSVTKSEPTPGAGTTVVAGQAPPVAYQFSVANAGGTATTAFTLTDPVPLGSTLVSGSASCPAGLTASTTPSCTIAVNGSTVTWTFSSLPALTTYSGFGFQVSVNANDANGTSIANAATFTNFNTIGCSTATCTTNTISNPVVTPPAVVVTKSEPRPGDGVTVTAGQAAPITYGFSAVNSGGSATGSFSITDTVPTGTTYVAGSATCPAGLTKSTTPSCTITVSGSTITWAFSSIPALTTYRGFGFQVTVNSNDANATSITNSATYTDVSTPGCAAAPTCTTNTITNPVVTPASISVYKTEPSPGNGVTVTAGQAAPLNYQLTVVNSGGTAAGAITVSDSVPTGTTYVNGSATCPNAACSVSFSTGTVTWTFSSVAALSTNYLTFQVSVNANDANGSTVTNAASFTDVNTPGCAAAPTCTTNTVSNLVLTPPSVSASKSEPTPGAGVTVTAGQATPITYQFSVANGGGEDSGAITITDSIPAGTTYLGASATCPSGLTTSSTPSCTITTGATITWTFSSIPALTTYSGFGFQVSVNANDANGTSIANAATFTNVNTIGCSTATCTTATISNPVVTPPAVTVTKNETSPGDGVTVTAGQTAPLTYGFSAANTGGSATGSFAITDMVPTGTTYVAGTAACPAGLTTTTTPSCTVTVNGSTITWAFSSIPALTTYGGFGFQVTVNSNDANATSITNSATYTNVNGPNCGNALTCTTNTISNPVITPASVNVTKSETSPGDGATVIAGQTTPITYQLAVVNSGGTPSGSVTVSDSLSNNVSYLANSATCPAASPACSVSFGAGTVTWTFTSVAPLSTNNLTFQATVNADAANGSTVFNAASFTNVNTPGCATVTCVSNTVSNPVSTIPVVSVSKSEPTPGAGVAVAPGQGITYRFEVDNFGGTPSGSVTVSDAVPAGTSLVADSATCPTGLTASSTPSCTITTGSTVTWTFSAIPAFTTYSSFGFQVSVNANAANGDTVSNSATFTDVNTAGCAGAPTCTTTTVTNPVVTPASVTVTKSEPTPGAGALVQPGQSTPLSYQFSVANSGGTDSGAFTVSDAVPTGTTLVSASAACPAGLTAATTPSCTITTGATITWTFSSIPKLTTYSGFGFQVSVNSNDADGTTISNSATFTNINTPVCDGQTCTTNTVSNLVDTPPTVSATLPFDSATQVALNAIITVNFSKAVTVTATAFTLECPTGTPVTFTVWPASPASTFVLTPLANLPSFTTCTVTVVATQVSDASSVLMAANKVFSFQTAAVPTAVNQTFSGAIGNTVFGVGTTPSLPSTSTTGTVLTGDTNGGAGTLSAVAGTITTANTASVTMNSDGTFVYSPHAGFAGSDTFAYTITNGTATATATVTVAVATPKVWYVNSALGSNGTGVSNSPFNVLSSAQTASSAGDVIFLYGSATSYTGGITLKSSQSLLGQSVGLVVSGHTLVTASGSNPAITNSGGAGITLGEADTVNGVTISSPSGAGITASSVNGATIGSSVTVTGATGDGIDITGGNGTFNVGATITTSSAHSVNVQTRSGGTTTFAGPITDTGTGVLLNGNSGAIVNFTGTISATTGTHQAFTATAGGTVSATGTASTLTTTSADALVVSSTTIGSGNLTFQSISSNGATDGISLTSTGTSGGLTVTGTGSAGTGGTIQNSTGAGVYADSAANINLSWMNIANNGSASTGGIGFDNGGDGVKLDNISGTGHLTSSTVTGSSVNNVEIHNNSATLSAFTIQGPSCSVTNNNTTHGDVGIQVLAENTGVITATVDSCNLSGNRTDAIQGNAASGTAGLTMTVTNNTIVAGTGGNNQGNIGVDVVGAAATTLGYTISGNKVGTPDGTTDAHLINDGINVFTAGTSSSAVGTVTNNTVLGPGVMVSGIPIRVITGTTSTGRSRIQGNTVHNLGFDPGILVQVGQNAGSTAHGDMGVFNNTVDNPPSSTGDVGINVETADAGVGCFSVTGNVKGQTGGAFADLNVVAAGTSTFDVAGATLGTITAATVQSYEAAHNFQTGPAGVVTAAKATNASFVGVASTACNIP